MFDNPEVVATVRRWVEKAENDLLTAANTLRLGRKCPTDTVSFHAQQCIEKYLKGLLVWRNRPFPRTHDLTALMGLLAAADRPELTASEQEMLTRYVTVTRYPGDYEAIPLSEARKAVKTARRVRRQIRKRLPKEALRAK
jgi:HEPN domain-containing protein